MQESGLLDTLTEICFDGDSALQEVLRQEGLTRIKVTGSILFNYKLIVYIIIMWFNWDKSGIWGYLLKTYRFDLISS